MCVVAMMEKAKSICTVIEKRTKTIFRQWIVTVYFLCYLLIVYSSMFIVALHFTTESLTEKYSNFPKNIISAL